MCFFGLVQILGDKICDLMVKYDKHLCFSGYYILQLLIKKLCFFYDYILQLKTDKIIKKKRSVLMVY